jgi:hypothetical protein
VHAALALLARRQRHPVVHALPSRAGASGRYVAEDLPTDPLLVGLRLMR